MSTATATKKKAPTKTIKRSTKATKTAGRAVTKKPTKTKRTGPRPTELVCVVDRSGSMRQVLADAEGGFNAFIDEQRKLTDAGTCHVTCYQFDTVVDTVWDRQELTLSKPRPYKLEPRGMTALLDAVGNAITKTNPEPDANVIFVIVTDGQENSSREWRLASLRTEIEHHQGMGWSFVFVGAGIDAFADGAQLGLRYDTTLATTATPAGMSTTYNVVGASVASARRHGTGVVFTDSQRKAAAQAGASEPSKAKKKGRR